MPPPPKKSVKKKRPARRTDRSDHRAPSHDDNASDNNEEQRRAVRFSLQPDPERPPSRRSLHGLKNRKGVRGGSMSYKSERFKTTEGDGAERRLTVQIREVGETAPMDRRRRRKAEFLRWIRSFGRKNDDASSGKPHNGIGYDCPLCQGDDDAFDDSDEIEMGTMGSTKGSGGTGAGKKACACQDTEPTHYHLTSNYKKRQSWWDMLLKLLCMDRVDTVTTGSDHIILIYMQWTFRSSFLAVFASQLLMFMLSVVVFAAFFVLAGKMQPACIQGGDYEGNTAFTDAFSLSWTTFSTVGYGATYPSLSPQYTEAGLPPGKCFYVDVISSMESFVGVLYAGFCGATIFGKVLRIQSKATVTFSEAVTIRYGDGVEQYDSEEEDDGDDVQGAPEIPDVDIDKQLDLIGGMEKLPLSSVKSSSLQSNDSLSKIPCPILEFRIVNNDFGSEGGEIIDASLTVLASFWDHMALNSERRRNHVLRSDHEPNSTIVPKRVLRQVHLEVREHPSFKCIWHAKHVMDEDSPLLTPEARKMVRRNEGFWPKEYNNPAKVRESIMFDEILVSLNGVSNLSTASVYAQKSYGLMDVVVGYQFARCMYRGEDGAVNVDTHMINDVFEQFGGGGEPLMKED